MTSFGAFVAIWVLAAREWPDETRYVAAIPGQAWPWRFSPAAGAARATRFAVYQAGGDIRLNVQRRREWDASGHATVFWPRDEWLTNAQNSPWYFIAIFDDPQVAPIQYEEGDDGALRLLSDDRWAGELEGWLMWLSRDLAGRPFTRHVEVSMAEIQSSKQARGADFTNVVLDGADLRGVDFTGAGAMGAVFKSASIVGTDFRSAKLGGTDFSETRMESAHFDEPANFASDREHLANFSGATVPFSVIGLDWSYKKLQGAQIVGLPVDADGRLQLQGLQAVSADLTGFDFHGAKLGSSNFSGATLTGANLAEADCSAASFKGAQLGGGPAAAAATLSRAVLFDADLTDAQLSGVNLSGAYLYGGAASVSGATMPGADLSNAYLASLDLSNVRDKNMAGAVFDGACLVNSNFTGTTVLPDANGKGGSFVRACLQGADFSGASLAGANLVEAAIAGPDAPPVHATLPIRGRPTTIPIAVNPAGTILPATATDAKTICPSGEDGPCVGAKLVAPHPPESWPAGSGR